MRDECGFLVRCAQAYEPAAEAPAAVVVPLGHRSSLPVLVEGVRHAALLVREQVRVLEGDVRALVAHALCYGGDAVFELDEQRHVTVPQVVYAYAVEPGLLATAIHLVVHVRFADLEDSVAGLQVFRKSEELADLLGEELRHDDLAHRFRRLRRGDDVFPVEALVRIRDA